ncbi:duplicated orphan permease [Filimonas lacunae]|uniref:Duplicated orphan permease n=2 Tax=Filimonas lacunae TaxID=477680 RepID=A0A1N7RG68_9BACT|nr:duplicated orphan permease [Filimonas lacunae]
MLQNHLKTAVRNLWKHKLTTLINVSGLAIGISAALIIYLYVQKELTFDTYEPSRNHIYRIVSTGPGWHSQGTPSPMHQVTTSLTGVETVSGFFLYDGWQNKVAIPSANQLPPTVFTMEDAPVFADGNYFSIFPRQWLFGNATASLHSPGQAVLTESKAQLYFPGVALQDVIGRTIVFNDTVTAVVSGIVKDLTANSDFNHKAFLSLSTIPHSNLQTFFNWNDWTTINYISQVMIRLLPGTTPEKVNEQLAAIAQAHKTGDKYADESRYLLQPLSDIHFNPDYDGHTSKQTLRNLVLLGIFLLLLGAINFINLSTAQSIFRAKEIGVRKTLGSSKKQLIFQFLTETLALTLLAVIISYILSPFLLKALSLLLEEELSFGSLNQPHILLFLLALTVVETIAAGLYPALVLTHFKPVNVLKNHINAIGHSRGSWQRKTLTVFQFVIAQIFMIGTLVVQQQVKYSIQKDVGFRKEAVVYGNLPFQHNNPDSRHLLFRDRLRKIPGVEAVSVSNQSPAFIGNMSNRFTFARGAEIKDLLIDIRCGDTGYLNLYHIPLIAGRNVLPTDTATEYVVNETMTRIMGFAHPQDAIGKYLNNTYPIVGVMRDFDVSSVRVGKKPVLFFSEPGHASTINIALQGTAATQQKTMATIQQAFKELYPDADFEYRFMDARIANFYKAERRISQILTWSTAVSVLISCLGLLGLVMFTANQRTREIGIRKVLGASVLQIISLLSRDFVKLVAIAFVIAVPIAWISTYKWLENYASHTQPGWWLFAISGILMLSVALLILSVRAGKAAIANPVKSLRSE